MLLCPISTVPVDRNRPSRWWRQSVGRPICHRDGSGSSRTAGSAPAFRRPHHAGPAPCGGAMTKERWLSYKRAWVAIAVDLDISLSKAERLIFDAFEAEVRVRVHKNGIAMVIPSDWWRDAEIGGFEIRLPDGTTTNRDEIDVNAYDLSQLVDE